MMVLPRASASRGPPLRAFARHEDAPRVKHPEPGVDRPHDVVDRVAPQQVAQLSDRPASRPTRPPTALSRPATACPRARGAHLFRCTSQMFIFDFVVIERMG